VTSALTKFREALKALGNDPTPEDLQRFITFARTLELKEVGVRDDITEPAPTLEGPEATHPLEHGDLSLSPPQTPDPFSPGDQCYFVAPVRFGRRRSDRYGHLVLTAGRLKFRGTLDLSVSWAEVAAVHNSGRDIIVALEASRRLLRFSCHSVAEGARGGDIAQHLARRAHPSAVNAHAAYQHGAI